MVGYTEKINELSTELLGRLKTMPKPKVWKPEEMGEWPPNELPLGTKFRRIDDKHPTVEAEVPITLPYFDQFVGRDVRCYHDPIKLTTGDLDRSLVLDKEPTALKEPLLCLGSGFPEVPELNVIYCRLVNNVVECMHQDVNGPVTIEMEETEIVQWLQRKLTGDDTDNTKVSLSVNLESVDLKNEKDFPIVEALKRHGVIHCERGWITIPNIEKMCGKGFYALVHDERELRVVDKKAESHHAASRVKEADYVARYDEKSGDWVGCTEPYETSVYKAWDAKIKISACNWKMYQIKKVIPPPDTLYLMQNENGKILYHTSLMSCPELLEITSLEHGIIVMWIRKCLVQPRLPFSLIPETAEAVIEYASRKGNIEKRVSKTFEPKEKGTFRSLLEEKIMPLEEKQTQTRGVLKKYRDYLIFLKKSGFLFTDAKPANISLEGQALDRKSIRENPVDENTPVYRSFYTFKLQTRGQIKFSTLNAYRLDSSGRYQNPRVPFENHDQIYSFLQLLEYAGLSTKQLELRILGAQSRDVFEREYSARAFNGVETLFDSTVRWLDMYENIPQSLRTDLTKNFVNIPLEKRNEYCDYLSGLLSVNAFQHYGQVVILLNRALMTTSTSRNHLSRCGNLTNNICSEAVWVLFKNDFFTGLQPNEKKLAIDNIINAVVETTTSALFEWIQELNHSGSLIHTVTFWQHLLTQPMTSEMRALLLFGVQEYRKEAGNQNYANIFENICTAVWRLEAENNTIAVSIIKILIEHKIFQGWLPYEIDTGMTNLFASASSPLLRCFIEAIDNHPLDVQIAPNSLKTVLLVDSADEKKVWKAVYENNLITGTGREQREAYVKELSQKLNSIDTVTNALYKKNTSSFFLFQESKLKATTEEHTFESRYQTLIIIDSTDTGIKFAQAFLKRAMNYLNRAQGGFLAKKSVRQAVRAVINSCFDSEGMVKDTVSPVELKSVVKKNIGKKETSQRGQFFCKAVEESEQMDADIKEDRFLERGAPMSDSIRKT